MESAFGIEHGEFGKANWYEAVRGATLPITARATRSLGHTETESLHRPANWAFHEKKTVRSTQNIGRGEAKRYGYSRQGGGMTRAGKIAAGGAAGGTAVVGGAYRYGGRKRAQ